jgi:hypothetical protein
MAHLADSARDNNTHLQYRILANLQIQASWVDVQSGKIVFVDGMTENLGEKTALINLQTLPPVGAK